LINQGYQNKGLDNSSIIIVSFISGPIINDPVKSHLPTTASSSARKGKITPKQKEGTNMTIFRENLKIGAAIIYVLHPHQRPIHPEKEWQGKIRAVYSSMDAAEVEVLNEGYKGEKERVSFIQIIRIECES